MSERSIDETRAAALLRQGLSLNSVARSFRVNTGRVRELADRLGIPYCPVPTVTKADEERIAAALRAGRTVKEIAAAECVTPSTIYRLADLCGVPLPARSKGREAASFVCASCGGRFNLPPAKGATSTFVMLGGRPWCERCASRRFTRRAAAIAEQSENAVAPLWKHA